MSLQQQQHKKQNAGVETFASLSAQHDSVAARLDRAREDLAVARQKQHSSGGQQQESAEDEEVDELDVFMSTVETGLRNETVDKLEKEVQELERELQRLERLVEIARPAWSAPSTVGTKKMEKPTKAVSFRLMPSPLPPKKRGASNSPERTFVAKNEQLEPPQNKSPAKDVPSSASSRNFGPSLTPEQHAAIRAAQEQKQQQTSTDPDEQEDATAFVEPDEDVTEWVPPANQRGDGTTALNDKFGY